MRVGAAWRDATPRSACRGDAAGPSEPRGALGSRSAAWRGARRPERPKPGCSVAGASPSHKEDRMTFRTALAAPVVLAAALAATAPAGAATPPGAHVSG